MKVLWLTSSVIMMCVALFGNVGLLASIGAGCLSYAIFATFPLVFFRHLRSGV